MELRRPEPPIGYSPQNWASFEDFKMAQQAYWNALAIYEMLDPPAKEQDAD